MFLLITDIYSDEKSFESIEFNFELKTNDNVIHSTSNSIKNFIISEMKKIQKLIDDLEIKFGGDVNYTHLFIVLKDYFEFISNLIEINPTKITSTNKDIMHKIILVKMMSQIIPVLFFDALLLNWNKDFLKYENNVFVFDPQKYTVSIYTSNILKELNNKSINTVIEEKVSKITYPILNRKGNTFFVDTLNFTEEFKETFKGSNSQCKTRFVEGDNFNNFEYQNLIKTEYIIVS